MGEVLIPVVDLFAGPGGLGEGFTAFRDSENKRVFKIVLSVEKDKHAFQTLRLRSFFRQFEDESKPGIYYAQVKTGRIEWGDLSREHPKEAKAAEEEVWCATLGASDCPPELVDERIRQSVKEAPFWVLIGGPPCQAYSVMGRVRMKGENPWRYARDPRHLLYKQYLHIIAAHRPPVFVMENVKGILSSKKAGKKIIDRIVADLREPLKAVPESVSDQGAELTYDLYPLADYDAHFKSETAANPDPARYIIRCEKHGIPQARHRFILLGIRSDLQAGPDMLPTSSTTASMWKAIKDLPPVRSRLSDTQDASERWVQTVRKIGEFNSLARPAYSRVLAVMKKLLPKLRRLETGGEYVSWRQAPAWQRSWFFDGRLEGVCNHSTRFHMAKDLWRYFYAACHAKLYRKSPVLADLPKWLLPEHKNVMNGDPSDADFRDRFRVQVKHRPATTVTSHIRKDGHYFIHPDPLQCRSLTVREAARLQTFPDNYFFVGPRTAQYEQVGNAVPPLLARQIAEVVYRLRRALPTR